MMTVGELIEELRTYPPEAEVHVHYSLGSGQGFKQGALTGTAEDADSSLKAWLVHEDGPPYNTVPRRRKKLGVALPRLR